MKQNKEVIAQCLILFLLSCVDIWLETVDYFVYVIDTEKDISKTRNYLLYRIARLHHIILLVEDTNWSFI